MVGPVGARVRQNEQVSTLPQRRRGPRTGAGPDTRDAIAAAARAEFSERGYAGATIRSIAARAEVDPALVHHYFGSKSELFQGVLALGFAPVRVAVPLMLVGPQDEAGARIVRTFLTLYEDPAFREPILALMRTAMTDPEVAAMAASFLQEAMLPHVATLALGPDPDRRVALAMTHLMGTMLGRHVIGLDALQGPVEDLVAQLGPVIQRYLDDTHA